MKAIRAAFYKRGLPEQLLVDNGSIYCSQEITLICAAAAASCDIPPSATPPPRAKSNASSAGNQDRSSSASSTSSLETLNCPFTHWVENDYNASTHDAIGMKPIDRFGIDPGARSAS